MIYYDNTIVVHFSTNNSSCSNYYDIKYLFVREKILEFETRIEHFATDIMVAGSITKGLVVGAL